VQPSDYRPRVGERVLVGLRVGHPGRTEPYGRNPGHIREFFVRTPQGRWPIAGRPGADPAGVLPVRVPGVHLLGYWSQPNVHEMAPQDFEVYLAAEGLESGLSERERRGEGQRPGREHFVRSAKALLVAGIGTFTGHDALLGLPLELVPISDPQTAATGDRLAVALLFDGLPVPGVLVSAFSARHLDRVQQMRTDAGGSASLLVTESGLWYLRAVHMVRSQEGSTADWTSYWASLSFEVPGAGAVAGQPGGSLE